MEITVHARHGRVPDSLRNQAVQRISRLEQIDSRITGATVVFDGAPGNRLVEARLSVAGGPPIVGHGDAGTLRAALEATLQRLERQVRRLRRRSIDGRARRTAIRETATP